MRLLTFQVRAFHWAPFSQTLPDADPAAAGAVHDAVVVFLHAEPKDAQDDRRASVFRQTLKHVKWLANKRAFKSIVLHSFTHLGPDTAPAAFARAFLVELEQRLASAGYSVHRTPFGWFCSWTLDVLGDSLAKVWKEI